MSFLKNKKTSQDSHQNVGFLNLPHSWIVFYFLDVHVTILHWNLEWNLTALLWLFFGYIFLFKLGENPNLRLSLLKKVNNCYQCHPSPTGSATPLLFANTISHSITHYCQSAPGKWQLCRHQLGGTTSTRKWWSCGPGSWHLPRGLWPRSGGTAGVSWAPWPPTVNINKYKLRTKQRPPQTDWVSVTNSNLLLSSLGKRKLALTAEVARKLLIIMRVGFTTGCEDKSDKHVCRLSWALHAKGKRNWQQRLEPHMH